MPETPIDYIPRMLELHAEAPPYRWAEPGALPPPAGPAAPLAATRIVVVSLAGLRLRTQAPYELRGDTSIRLVPVDAAPAELAFDHFGFKVERAAADPETTAPLAALRALAADGTIGGVAPLAIGAMGATYSQRRVGEELVPTVTAAALDSAADLALIVPACPLDHQTAALVARGIEAAGMRALVISGARDISLRVGAPRTVYVHAPLGWLLGVPGDAAGQRERLAAALAAGIGLPGMGELVDLDPAYPSGAAGTPHSSRFPELTDWEAREYRPGYDTGITR